MMLAHPFSPMSGWIFPLFWTGGGAGAPCASHTREAIIEAADAVMIDGDNQANSNFTQKEDLP
jgi:hypothetical protein